MARINKGTRYTDRNLVPEVFSHNYSVVLLSTGGHSHGTGLLFHEQTCSRFTRLLGWLFVTMPEIKAKDEGTFSRLD